MTTNSSCSIHDELREDECSLHASHHWAALLKYRHQPSSAAAHVCEHHSSQNSSGWPALMQFTADVECCAELEQQREKVPVGFSLVLPVEMLIQERLLRRSHPVRRDLPLYVSQGRLRRMVYKGLSFSCCWHCSCDGLLQMAHLWCSSQVSTAFARPGAMPTSVVLRERRWCATNLRGVARSSAREAASSPVK